MEAFAMLRLLRPGGRTLYNSICNVTMTGEGPVGPRLCRFHHKLLTLRFPHKAVQQQQQLQPIRVFRTRRGTADVVAEKSSSPRPRILGPACFTAFVCGTSFIGATIWQYETMRYHAKKILKRQEQEKSQKSPDVQKQFGFREHFNSMWNNLSRGQRLVVGIIAANIGVFLMWKMPRATGFMMKYFTSSPASSNVSMLLSAFSHYNWWHMFINMYVLWSFSNAGLQLFGKEQFMAMYLSAATVSAFASHLNKVVRKSPMPSLGASGAIMALLGAVCIAYPNSQLSIAFVSEIFPHSFSAQSAMWVILAVDTMGLLMGWRMFDHAAHLGGMLFGILYMSYGRQLFWEKREPVMRLWHDMRGKP